ncbi:MAG: Y-family DNA polymerase [Tidjanibacter sp.]|nr:Y-family DNA polymerase [Tidjanibacter sp.]
MFALADCNNFFASCERVFRPDLQGRPIIVLSSNDGCAVARSNEAKALGIKMGAPLFQIKDIVKRHNVALFSGNMALYGDMSQRVRWVLEEYAPSVEVYSIDECFLDLRGMTGIDFDAYAKEISSQCWRQTSIPVSVGIAPTKTLAKIASKLCKQYPKLRGGCYMHRPEDIEKVLRKFPIEDVWGIGRRSTPKLKAIGVCTAYDFTQLSRPTVQSMLGITGLRTWNELRGVACIEFEDGFEAKQSICVSRSFSSEIYDVAELQEQIANFASTVAEKLRGQRSATAEMVVFAYTNRFKESQPQTYSNSLITFATPTADHRTIVAEAAHATQKLFKSGYGYKKAGVVATKILPEGEIMRSLFDDTAALEREQKITSALDSINATFGAGTIKLAVQGSGKIKSASESQSPHYTTRWSDIPKASVK